MDRLPTPEAGYESTVEGEPHWSLPYRAYGWRYGATIGFGIANWTAPFASQVIWLDSTLAKAKGSKKIRVDMYEPLLQRATQPFTKRPAIINFHGIQYHPGGGFILGAGTDDARWADMVRKAVGAVVFSVNYRLAPEYPFPTPVEDVADSIMQICARAEEFGLDREKIVLSGFSAGGNLSLASWVLLQDPGRWGYVLPLEVPKIAGMALFYPVLDATITRTEKREECMRPDMTLPKGMTDVFDASYINPPIPRDRRDDPRLSPGLMADAMLEALPPIHLCLCEYDMLLAEGLQFGQRLMFKGKNVSVRVAEGVQHGWDKHPFGDKSRVGSEYQYATEAIKRWLYRGRPETPLDKT